MDWASGSDGERWLAVTPLILEHLTLYRPEFQGQGGPQHSGLQVPYASRGLGQRGLLFRLPPAAGVETLYLRVESRSTLMVEPCLWPPRLYESHIRHEDFLLALAAGMILTLAGFHFLSGLFLTGRPSLLYSGFLMVMLANTLAWYGMFGALLAPGMPWVDRWAMAASFPGILACAWPLFGAVVGLPRSWARWDRRLAGAGGLVAGAGALGYLLGQPLVAGAILSFGLTVMLVLLFLAGGWLAATGNRVARLYLLAFVPLIVPVLLALAQNLSLFPAVQSIRDLQQWSMIFHLILMNLPMTDHWLRLSDERDEAQAEALAAAQNAEYRLEGLVVQRTAELREAKIQAEAALKASVDMVEGQRKFIRTVNHEFRTPLAVLDGNLQVLGQETTAGASERLPRMRAKIRNLLDLLDTALDQDRLETGVWGRNSEVLDPSTLVRKVIGLMDANPDRHPIQVQDAGFPETIQANPVMLSILLSNLLSNAVRYSPDGGAIRVDGQVMEGGWFRIRVADHGIGLARPQMERLFEPYYRTGQMETVAGTGLGLHLAREIARLQGGDLTVESCPGQGSTFTVIIPHPPVAPLSEPRPDRGFIPPAAPSPA